MGAPSQEQIDDAIASGLARGLDENTIVKELADLSRLSDEELAAFGVDVRESAPAPAPIDFEPAPVRRRVDGWTADRQRDFIAALAETGCVSEACAEVGITARSAYRLRMHPAGACFRDAWDHAQHLASTRLTALAWERAVHGGTERLYRDGELVAERRKASDRLLMWLLSHHNPETYGWAARPGVTAPNMSFFPMNHAVREYPGAVSALTDVDGATCPAEGLLPDDFATCEGSPPRA